MKVETEVKYRIAGTKNIKKELSVLGFKLVKKIFQKDYYFSPPHRNFARSRVYYLRLRHQNKEGIFAYHVVSNNIETKEWEVGVNSFDTFLEILKLLDFRIDCIIKKSRLIYKNNDIRVMIDKVDKLGNFVEIEYNSKITEKIKETFSLLTNKLKLEEKNLIKGVGYPDLLMSKSSLKKKI